MADNNKNQPAMNNKSRNTLVMNGITASPNREEHDFYATSPEAAKWLLSLEPELRDATILEPCCGTGHLSKVFTDAGLEVVSSDIVDRGYGSKRDFFSIHEFNGHIVTNPPFTDAKRFVTHALDIIPPGRLVCMFLKLTFLEGIKRRRLFDTTPPGRCGYRPLASSAHRMGTSPQSREMPSPTAGSSGRRDGKAYRQ